MADGLTETLIDLEHRGWDSLCDGTGSDFYGAMMTGDGHMVLANGWTMSRDEVVEALAQAPPWDSYSIDDVRLVMVGAGAALVYRGTARRDGAADVVCVMTSVYVVTDDGWRLALYTQTPCG